MSLINPKDKNTNVGTLLNFLLRQTKQLNGFAKLPNIIKNNEKTPNIFCIIVIISDILIKFMKKFFKDLRFIKKCLYSISVNLKNSE